MREILFRGFHEDENGKETICLDGRKIKGFWVYGYYFIHNPEMACLSSDQKPLRHLIIKDGSCDWGFEPPIESFEVIPETVGQYTGLTDKTDKMIFENDIIKTQPYSDRPYSAKAKSKQHVGVVYYHIRQFKNSKNQQNYEALWDVKIKDMGKYVNYSWSAFYRCEVIGNIFSNPELLKDKE